MLDRLTIERTEALCGAQPLIVALSGGGDSVALLHLLAEQCGTARLHAIVIDHALREGSAADAAQARDIAEALGVRAEIIRIDWPNGPKRAQASARDARYAALAAAARRLKARVIVTGHTRDDQAETVLMRAARGSSWRGLAGMRALAPAPIWPEGRGVWLARPLLDARREDLRTLLRARDARWIEDPANANADFARVRARQVLADPKLDAMRFAVLAERLQPRAVALDEAAHTLIAAAATFEDDAIVVNSAHWQAAPAICARALSVLFAAAGGQSRAREFASDQDMSRAFTRDGALLRPTTQGFQITRDPGALSGRADGAKPPQPLLLALHEEAVWDNRLALTAREPGWSVSTAHGKPVLTRGAEQESIANAGANWLLLPRVDHLLGRINDTKFE